MRVPISILAILLTGAAPCVQAASDGWTTLTGGRLEADPANDGDSFHVRHEGKTYLFRLYFVDCPETSRQIPSRVRRQAKYWKAGEEEVLARGTDAAAFTRGRLQKPFVVHTKWQDAKGKSRSRRYFAFVTTAAGKDLATELVRTGYARTYGASAEHPDGTSAQAMWRRLDSLEEEAREAPRRHGSQSWRRRDPTPLSTPG